MRARTLILIFGIMLVAGFAALNVDEFTRPSLLSLGFTTITVPLGMVMLLLLVAVMLVFLATTLYIQSANMLETRQYARDLNAQRELADKAEASRFTELRTFLVERLDRMQADTQRGLEQNANTIGAVVAELEDRLERGHLPALERSPPPRGSLT